MGIFETKTEIYYKLHVRISHLFPFCADIENCPKLSTHLLLVVNVKSVCTTFASHDIFLASGVVASIANDSFSYGRERLNYSSFQKQNDKSIS